MVAIATALGRTGFQEWLIQRVTAVVMTVYLLGLVGFICFEPQMNYETWMRWFECSWVKYATLLTIVSISAHAWIGIWTVTTDYVKPLFLRLPLPVVNF